MWPFERFRLEPDMSLRSLRSIIAGQPPAVAEKTATVLEAAILMKEKSKGALLVVDGTRLTGIFTERDALFRVIAAGRDAATTTLADVMTPQPQTMHPDEPFLKALRLMHKRGFRHLPSVENGSAAGRGVRSRCARRRLCTNCASRWRSGKTSGIEGDPSGARPSRPQGTCSSGSLRSRSVATRVPARPAAACLPPGPAVRGRPSSSGSAVAHIPAHDRMMKRSTKRPSSPRSRNTRHSLAPLRRRMRSTLWMNSRKRSTIGRIDPVLDLNQHRAHRRAAVRPQSRGRASAGRASRPPRCPSSTRTRRLRNRKTSSVPPAAGIATRVPSSEASQPQNALPNAMLACTAMMIHRDRARAHPGRRGGLRACRQGCERTPVHDAPVANAPRSAAAV